MPPLKVWSHAFRLMSTAALRQAVLLRLVFGQASCSCTVAISPVHTQARALLNLRRAVSWMPRLRSATSQIQEQFGSNAIACGPAPQASECHLQHQQDGDKPDVQPEQTSPAARKPAQKQRKRATSSKMPVMTVESASDAASPETAMQQTPRKKVKVRKALLSTLWTTDQLVPLQTKVEKLYIQLNELYKDPPCPLNFDSPFQLLVAVILSAQVCSAESGSSTPHMLPCSYGKSGLATPSLQSDHTACMTRLHHSTQPGFIPTKVLAMPCMWSVYINKSSCHAEHRQEGE